MAGLVVGILVSHRVLSPGYGRGSHPLITPIILVLSHFRRFGRHSPGSPFFDSSIYLSPCGHGHDGNVSRSSVRNWISVFLVFSDPDKLPCVREVGRLRARRRSSTRSQNRNLCRKLYPVLAVGSLRKLAQQDSHRNEVHRTAIGSG